MNINKLFTSIEVFTTTHNLQITGLSNINESYYEHNIVYKMINKINGKHYIGQHVTKNPLDEYSGSGNLIVKAVHKYSLSSFVKEILFDFDNFDEMNKKEQELVPLSSCYPNDLMSYNLMEGGHNGRLTEETKKKLSESKMGEKNPWHKIHGLKMPMNRKDVQEKARLKRIGQKRTDEQKKHISKSMKGKCCGKDHIFYKKSLKERLKDETFNAIGKTKDDAICPQDFMNEYEIAEWKNKLSKAFTGRIRIYNPITKKRHLINANDLQMYLDAGWIIGYNCSSIGGKIAIHNPITQKTKYIIKDDLEKYIANS